MKPIVVDAMGGDFGPSITVAGACAAAKEGIDVVLVGIEDQLNNALKSHGMSLPIVHASEVVGMNMHATDVRKLKDASINVAMNLLKAEQGSALVAMGHTGATLAAAMFTLGRIKGVERPTILVEMPSAKGRIYLVDGGANADCKPSFLVQFAQMGHAYAITQGVNNPTVGLLNIGEEETKGNQLALETYPLLKELSGINFYGNIEGKDIFKGTTNIVVTDGFTGNVVLKLSEGEAKIILGWVKEALNASIFSRIGALLARPHLRAIKAKMDPSEYGAMPLLGVNGIVMIGHGSGDALAVTNAIKKAHSLAKADIVNIIKGTFA